MLVVTGIMLISLVLALFNFPTIKWGDLAMIVFFSLVATAFSVWLIVHCDRKRGLPTLLWVECEVMTGDDLP